MSVWPNSSPHKALKLTKATEFEKEKNLPKFEHVPMAVINPIPKKKKEHIPEPDYT